MGKLFGIFHHKEEVEAPYYNVANGWWPKREVRVYFPPGTPLDKKNAIMEGFQRWKAILQNPIINLTVSVAELPTEGDIFISFSDKKPKNSDGKEVWAITISTSDPPSLPKNYKRTDITFWSGLNINQQKDSAAHEGGHAWGLTQHSTGGLMDPDIEVGFPNKWDEETLLISYRQRKEFGLEPVP